MGMEQFDTFWKKSHGELVFLKIVEVMTSLYMSSCSLTGWMEAKVKNFVKPAPAMNFAKVKIFI